MHYRPIRRLAAGLLVLAAASFTATDTAGAATLQVCASGCPYAAVAPAVAAAAPGDTITVGAGTFSTFGVVIDKPLSIIGSGAGVTVLDGGGGSTGSVPGIFRILPGAASKGTGDVTISDLTVQNPSKNTTATTYFGISIGVKQVTTGITAINLNRLDIRGTGDPARPSYGIYADGGYTAALGDRTAPPLTLADSTVSATHYNGVGIDAYRGDVVIERNVLTEGGNGTSALVFLNEYSPNQIPNPVIVRDNTSTGRLVAVRNIDVNAALAAMGGFADVRVTGNTITNLGPGDFGVLISTNSVDGAPATRIGSAVVTGNTITGTGATTSSGISIGGAVVDTLVRDNTVTGVGTGVTVLPVKNQYAGTVRVTANELRSDGTGVAGLNVRGGVGAVTAVANDLVGWQTAVVVAPQAAAQPGAVDVHENRIFGNAAGLENTSTTTVLAEDNWWGCQAGPTGTSSYCNEAVGPLTASHWIRVAVEAVGKSPDGLGRIPVLTGESVPVTVSLVRTDGTSETAASGLPAVFNDFPVAYDAQLGSLTGASDLGGSYTASATYVAPGAAGEDLTHAVVDREDLTPVATGEPVPLRFVISERPVGPTPTITPTSTPTSTPTPTDGPTVVGPTSTGDPDPDDGNPGDGGVSPGLGDTGAPFPLWAPFLGLGLLVTGVIVLRLAGKGI